MTKEHRQTKRLERKTRRANHIVRSVETARVYQKPTRTRVKISHNAHTGKRLPIHCTSYAILFFLLIFTGIFTFYITGQSVVAGPPIVDSGAITVSGTVYGSPPTQPPVITSPNNGEQFTGNSIDVSGTCISGLLVEIYRNNAFAGSQICDSNGEFNIQITIIVGKNVLIAKMSDSLNQYSPDSDKVLVFLKAGASGSGTVSSSSSDSSTQTSVTPLLIYTKPVQRGVFPDELLRLKYEVEGGKAPYAVSLNWGDASNPDVIPLDKAGDFEANHIFEKAGQYTIALSVTDVIKGKAYTQTIAVINGAGAPLSTNIFSLASAICSEQQGLSDFSILKSKISQGQFAVSFPNIFADSETVVCSIIQNANVIWPLFIIACVMTFSFWVGERVVIHRYKLLQKHQA